MSRLGFIFQEGEQRRLERIGDKFNHLCHNSWAKSSSDINLKPVHIFCVQVKVEEEVEVRNVLFFQTIATLRKHGGGCTCLSWYMSFNFLFWPKNRISVILYFLSVADSNPCISQQTGTSFAHLTFFVFPSSHFVNLKYLL